MSALTAALHELKQYFVEHDRYPGGEWIYARCRGIIRAYAKHYEAGDKQAFLVKTVEELVTGPIINWQNKKNSGYLGAGKIDVTLWQKEKRRLSIMDHKILASEFDDHHHEHLLVDTQPLQYAYLKHLNGTKIDSAIWDVIAKTGHRPCKNETAEQFSERIFQLYSAEPNAFFNRREIPLMDYHMAQYANDLHTWTKMLDSAIQTGQHLKIPESCFQYRRPCEYLPICSGTLDIDRGLQSGRLVKIDERHPELELPEGTDPHKVITNSRLKKFRSCMYRHHLHYNEGLRRAGQVTEEPLFVGSAMHKALEGYWLYLKECAS